ncbi:unnamed protein product, partial [marine sediment metagenome]
WLLPMSSLFADDTEPPVITLLGDAIVNLTVGDTYTDAGATAWDNEDGDLKLEIVEGGDTVDTNAVGTYIITYNVSDSAANAATEVTRTVNILAGGIDVRLDWAGQGKDHADLSGCTQGYWHWILTPGGNNVITSATLHVTYASGSTSQTTGATRSGGTQGAFHFDVYHAGDSVDIVNYAL